MQRTKIIATIGPASENLTTLKKMMQAGMDVARINLSHNQHAHHLQLIKNIRKTARDLSLNIPIVLDLQGPKIRIGDVREGIKVKKNEEIFLFIGEKKVLNKNNFKYIPVQFKNFYKYAKKGGKIYIDDASIELKVLEIRNKKVKCKVLNKGNIKSHKGINIPGANIKCEILSKKDLADLEFGIKNKVDYVALSYVETEKDILKLRKKITQLEKKYNKNKGVEAKIIAKIERAGAIKNFDKILEATDAVMVARGDLGLEVPFEDLPLIQKNILTKCLQCAKPAIVATQMLGSMTNIPYPSRAEISDVANAVLDGADAVMLSNETASGKYPIKAVRTMKKIIREVEPVEIEEIKKFVNKNMSMENAMASVCKDLAKKIKAKAIVCISGFDMAGDISRYRPKQPIIFLSSEDAEGRQSNLLWGVSFYVAKKAKTFDKFIDDLRTLILKEKIVKKGDKILITGGYPVYFSKEANLIKIETL